MPLHIDPAGRVLPSMHWACLPGSTYRCSLLIKIAIAGITMPGPEV